jgi:hypothetical protein
MRYPAANSVRAILAGALAAALLPSAATLLAQDAGLVAVLKQQSFRQEQPVAPALRSDAPPLGFWSIVEPTATGTILGATVELPGGNSRTLLFDTDGDQFRFEETFGALGALGAAYPNGDYTVRMTTQNDGLQALTVTLTGDTWPSAPRVANLAAFQNFNAAQNFTLQWDTFVGGTVNDLILVSIYDPQSGQEFSTPGPGEPGSLTCTSTSVVIPAGTFGPGAVLEAELDFVKIVDFEPAYSGAFAAYLKITEFEGRTTGGSDTQAPRLDANYPFLGETGIVRDAVISFTFDEPMQSGTAINWTGVSGGSFAYSWSADRRTLFCRYATALPADASISWTLNPAGQAAGFRDLAGNPLPEWLGQFITGPAESPSGADVRELFMGKGRFYSQTGASPVPGLFVAEGFADLRSPNSVTNASITLPNGHSVQLEYTGDRQGFDVEAAYASQTDLDLFFPSGDYVASFNTIRDGTRSVTLTLSGNQYPNAPTISDLAAAQAINPAAAFHLNWQAFAGGTAADYIAVEIESEYGAAVFESPNPGQPGALTGTATGILIPAGTLAPGRTYIATVAFLKVVDQETAAYPGLLAVAGYFSETEFSITTTGTLAGPVWSVVSQEPTNLRVRLTGAAGIPYTVEETGNFQTWDFNRVIYFDDGASSATFDLPISSGPGSSRFFRAREGHSGPGVP